MPFDPHSLESFLCYVQPLTDTHSRSGTIANFGDSPLLDSHLKNSILFVDKYVLSAVPDNQLEFLLESQGKNNFCAELCGIRHRICTHGELSSDLFAPNIKAEHYNPYKRFMSNCASASRACGKILDLAGLEIVDLDYGHDNCFLEVVCTFPFEVSRLLVNPAGRVRAKHQSSSSGTLHKSRLDIDPMNILDRANRCRESFFKALSGFFGLPNSKILGCSSSLHTWSSEVPVLPHLHVHNLIPFFAYDKKVKRDDSLIQDTIAMFNNPEIVAAVDILDPAKHGCIRHYGSMGSATHFSTEVKLTQRFVVDRDLYTQLRLELSNKLSDMLGFVPVAWFSDRVPIDVNRLRELWSDIVYTEFGADIMDNWQSLDTFVAFIPYTDRSKLLHALSYKGRPAVLDLDLFFRECKNFVLGYSTSNKKLDTDLVVDFLNRKLEIAIRCSDYTAIDRYESMLLKAESIFCDFSYEDIYSWLEYLAVAVTDTRVFGFWRNINRFLLDPDHKLLVVEQICPICNGSIASVGVVDYCSFDFVFIRMRSKFLVCNVNGDI